MSARFDPPATLPDDAVDVLARQGVSPVDRAAFRNAFGEAAAAWPGPPSRRWWKWLVEACDAAGLHAKVIEATVGQARELARRGVGLITLPDGPDAGWVAIGRFRGGRFEVVDGGERRRSTPQAVAERLGRTGVEDIVVWVAVDRQAAVARGEHGHGGNGHGEHGHGGHGHGGDSDHAHPSPVSRLLTLLRAERSDMWVVVVFALFGAVLALATPIAVESLVNTVAFGRFLQPVVVLSLLLFVFLAFGAAMRALQTYVVEIIQQRLFVRVVSDLAHRLPRVRHDGGEYLPEAVNRFLDVVTVQKATASLLLDGVALVVATVVGMAVLAFYHPWLLGFDLFLLLSMAVVVFGLGRGAVRTSIGESKTKYATAAWLEEVARCRAAFALGGADGFAAGRADELATRYLKDRRAHFRVLMRQVVFALGLQAAAGTVLLGLGGWLVIAGQLTLGQLVAAELIVAVIVGAFAKLGKHLESFYDLLAAMDKLGHLFDLPTEPRVGLLSLPEAGPAAVRVRSLSAAFPDGPAVFAGLDFAVAAGEAVAVLGPSGAGKTVLAEILFGLRRPAAGYVEFDGVDPRDVRPDIYRSHVALAGPAEFLDGTVTENVALDRPHVGPAEVREALRAVGLLDRLLERPDGLKTRLTPAGAPLSAGDARRLLVARAIAGRPRLLVVDGLLDAAADGELDDLTAALTAEHRTVIVTTARRDVAARFERTVALAGGDAVGPAADRGLFAPGGK